MLKVAQMSHGSNGFCRISQKIRRFQNAAKFSKADFMKGIVILVKVDEMYKMLKSLLTNRFWSRDGIG